jgi:hypothetical protein
MPNAEVDYSTTVIYKIVCKNENVKDIYVGHTTNFIKRKNQHKQSSTSVTNNCKLYKTIRENGGWENWKMTVLNFFECNNKHEALQKEQEYFLLLNANLNSVEPCPERKEKTKKNKGKKKNKKRNNKDDVVKEDKVKDEVKDDVVKDDVVKDDEVKDKKCVYCKYCDITCTRESEWKRHIVTRKHISKVNGIIVDKKPITEPEDLTCGNCKKTYVIYGGLLKHLKKCKPLECVIVKNHLEDLATIVIEIVETNQVLTNNIAELLKNNQETNKNMLEMMNTIAELLKNKS